MLCYLRCGKFLDNKIARGYKEEDLDGHEQQLLRDYRSGALLEARNKAVLEFGHGKVVDSEGAVRELGGSTGGLTRRIIGE